MKTKPKIYPPKGYSAVGIIGKALSSKLQVKQGVIYANIKNIVEHIKKRHPDVVEQEPDLDAFVKKTLNNYSEISKTTKGGIMLIFKGVTHSPIAIAKYEAKFDNKKGFWIVRSIWIKNNSKLPQEREKVKSTKKKKNR